MKLNFQYKDKEIEFDIIRSKRKTISIKIEENGKIIVSAPLRINKEYILQAVQSKADWIIKSQAEIGKRDSKKITREVIEGSTFMYLGEEYPLNLIFNKFRENIHVRLSKVESYAESSKYITSNIDINSANEFRKEFYGKQKFIIHTNTMNEEKIKIAFEKWYRAETLKIVTQRIDYYADNFKDKVTNIRVKEQK